MPRYEDLLLRAGEPSIEAWYDRLVSHLTDIAERGAVTYGGYILRDLIPQIDLMLNLGMRTLRLLRVHTLYAYIGYAPFSYVTYPQPITRWVLLSNYEGLIAFDTFTGKRYRVQMTEIY